MLMDGDWCEDLGQLKKVKMFSFRFSGREVEQELYL